MKSKKIDMQSYARKKHFDYFNSLGYPYVGITASIEITEWISILKENKYPFFHSFLHAVTNAANMVEEFRQRIVDGEIIEYDECASSYTVSLKDETYCYCRLQCNLPINEFITYAKEKQQKAIEDKSIDDGEDSRSLYFISSLPWITYTNIIQPVPIPADSNPRITWGRYVQVEDKIIIPVTLLCHHALVDGIHINMFYENLKMQLENDAKIIKSSNDTIVN